MGTILLAIVGVLAFFMFPLAVIFGAIGLWIFSGSGAIAGVIVGMIIQSALTP
jgi:hypothetical protein